MLLEKDVIATVIWFSYKVLILRLHAFKDEVLFKFPSVSAVSELSVIKSSFLFEKHLQVAWPVLDGVPNLGYCGGFFDLLL